MLRSTTIRASKRFNSTSAIQYYKTPLIPHIDNFANQGIQGLLSAKGLQNAWYKRAELYCEGLNQEIAKQGLAAHDVEVLVREYAKSATKSKLFNNASLLSNTEFAISSLGSVRDETLLPTKPEMEEALLSNPDLSKEISNLPVDTEFQDWIQDSFGSILEFKTLLLNSANAINGDGFTWLVARKPKRSLHMETSAQKDEYDNLYVLNTYNAGTPNNSIRFGQLTEISRKLKSLGTENDSFKLSTSSILSLLEAKNIAMYDDVEYQPILAIDASPKVWLHDYGVFGKKTYLEQVWKAIDWDIVTRRLPKRAQSHAIQGRVI